jgi:cell division transport system ATP-binding protein
MALFQAFNQVGVTVLVATHAIDLINSLPYPKLVLKHGRLAFNGFTESLHHA